MSFTPEELDEIRQAMVDERAIIPNELFVRVLNWCRAMPTEDELSDIENCVEWVATDNWRTGTRTLPSHAVIHKLRKGLEP